MREVVTIALKDLRLLARDKFGAFWILVFPLMFALFFGFVFASPGGRAMGIIVVDEDQSTESKGFIDRLAKSKSLNVQTTADEEVARQLVQRGKQVAYLVLPKGFGGMGYFGPQKLSIELGVDPSRKAEAGFLQGLLAQAYFTGMQDLFTNPARSEEQLSRWLKDLETAEGMPKEAREAVRSLYHSLKHLTAAAPFKGEGEKQPDNAGFQGPPISMKDVSREGVPRSSWEITFPSAILWGIFSCLTGFAGSLVKERTQGTFLRLRTAPLTVDQVLAGKGFGCFVAQVGVSFLFLFLAMIVFGLRVDNWLWLILAILCSAFCFTGMMMFISTLGRSEEAVVGAGFGILMPMAMLGGGMIPLIAMPPWLAAASNISPFKWSIFAVEVAIWRGATFVDVVVPYLILLAVGGVCLYAGVRILKWREG